jgi:hypothetical protein
VILITGIKKATHLYCEYFTGRKSNPSRQTIANLFPLSLLTSLPSHLSTKQVLKHAPLICTLNQGNHPSPTKILVISKQPQFSEDMMTYSLEMATKRNAEIVALNLDEQERDFEGFQKMAQNNVTAFLQKAQEAGVCFSHMVCDGPEERVVEHLHAAIDGFTYVMDDIPAILGANHAIPVYVHSE